MVARGPRTNGKTPGSVSMKSRCSTSARVQRGFTSMPSGVCHTRPSGSAPLRSLRASLATYMSEDLKLRPCTGGYFFRYEPTASEEEALDRRLASYLDSHGGLLPAGNAGPQPGLRLAARRVAA